MKFTKLLTTNRVALGCLCAGALAVASCADGPGSLTGPSASAVTSSLTATSAATEQPVGQGAVTANLASASSPIQHLLVRKTCDAINHCTVVESETGPLPVGTEAFYTGPLLESRTTSGVILTTPAGDTAKGNCSLNYNTGLGTCVFTSGTGALAGFHANLKVTSAFPPENPDGIFTWDGTYHFVGRD